MTLLAKSTSTVLKLPRVGSAALSRRSRTQVALKKETSVGWLNSGISSGSTCRSLARTWR